MWEDYFFLFLLSLDPYANTDVNRELLVVIACVLYALVCLYVSRIVQSPISVQKKSIARENRHARFTLRLPTAAAATYRMWLFCHLRSGTHNVAY